MSKLRLLSLVSLFSVNLVLASDKIDFDNFDPILELAEECALKIPVFSKPGNPFSAKRTPQEHEKFKKRMDKIISSIHLNALKIGWIPAETKQ